LWLRLGSVRVWRWVRSPCLLWHLTARRSARCVSEDMASTTSEGDDFSGQWSDQCAASDAIVHLATAESLVKVASGDDERRERPPRIAVVRVIMLLLGLCAYTFGPLLVNWSVLVAVPPAAEATILTAPARSRAQSWYGVTLKHQPGTAELYVDGVSKGGLAYAAGVLPGDMVSRGEQDGATVFDRSSYKSQDSLLEVKGFIEKAPIEPYPKASPPLISPVKPLTLIFDMEHVDVKKGETYLGFGIVFMRNVVGSSILLIIYVVCFQGSLSKLYTPGNIAIFILPGLGGTCADLFEVLANGRTDAALYSVLSQSRLVCTAMVMRMLLGKRQSTPQVICLVSVTLVILSYMQVPDSVPIGQYWNGFGMPYDPNDQKTEETDPRGVLYAFCKIGLSVLLGVVSQKSLQKEELKAMPLVGLQALIWSLAAVATLPLMLLYMWVTHWDKGVFGGYPAEFHHCVKSWGKATCDSPTPVLVEQGWDYRTVAVLFFYIFRELTLNGVLREFDAVTKNLVNSSASVSTYFLSLALLGKDFNFAKCGLTCCIMLQIVQYMFSPAAT